MQSLSNYCYDNYLFTNPDSARYFIKILRKYSKVRSNGKFLAESYSMEAISYWVEGKYTVAKMNFEKAAKFFNQIGDKKGFISTHGNLANLACLQGEYDSSMIKFRECLTYFKHIGDTENIAITKIKIGDLLMYKSDLLSALDYYISAVTQAESINRREIISESYSKIGQIHFTQKNYQTALDYYTKTIITDTSIFDKTLNASAYGNIANVYYVWGKYDMASEYFNMASDLYRRKGAILGYFGVEVNLGMLAIKNDNLSHAEVHYINAKSVLKDVQDLELMINYLNLQGQLFLNKKQFKMALKSTEQIHSLSKQMRFSQFAYDISYQAYESLHMYDKAIYNYKRYIEIRDSLMDFDSQKATIENTLTFEYEKKQVVADAEHEKEMAVLEEKEKQQQLVSYTAAGGLILVLAFLAFVFNRLKVTRRQKVEIEKQKEEADFQRGEAEKQTKIAESNMNEAVRLKQEIEQHHKEIQDSINYAKRIQDAIMPSMESMHQDLKNGFVFYLPKNVVAGDFFWKETMNDIVYYAAADCTGHGVPGAMVSVVCSNALSKALIEEGKTNTAKLLDRTRELVIERLARSGEDVKDGMDISLCALNMKTKQLQWSGANNPLWILRKGAEEFEETKADKQPIGKFHVEKPFTSHEVSLNEGDTIYIFTDGYQDQFGGPKGKKFKPKQLKKLILELQSKSMDEQKAFLDHRFREWQGGLEQVDDVCIIGVRV